MRVVAVADIAVERSTAAFLKAGVPAGKIALITSHAAPVLGGVTVTVAGDADTALTVAVTAHAEGQSIATDRADWLATLPFVNVIDATVGFILKQMAAEAGVVYTGSAGDEPANVIRGWHEDDGGDDPAG